jgi:hypothetical protein
VYISTCVVQPASPARRVELYYYYRYTKSTTPSRQTYTTHPGSRLLFPTLCKPTAPVSAPANVPCAQPNRGLKMPRRKTTREQDRAKRIDAERARNQELRENPGNDCDDAYFPSRPRPPGDDDPPPF